MIRVEYAIIGTILALLCVTNHYDNLYDQVVEENHQLKMKYGHYDYDKSFGMRKVNVTVTMYNPTRGQTDRTPNITADGTKINPKKATSYRYVALSRDLLKRWGGPFNYKDFIIIEGTGKDDGIYQVRDTMNRRFTNRVDILKTYGSREFKYNNATMYKYEQYTVYNTLADNE